MSSEWPALPEGYVFTGESETVTLEGDDVMNLLGLRIGDDTVTLNGAGRPMRIPWDADLGRYEPAADDPLWWMSFCDPGLPQGSQFLGVAIIQAPTFPAALTRSHLLGVNPGGQVMSAGPIPAPWIGAEYRDRLLNRDEAMAVPEPEGLS